MHESPEGATGGTDAQIGAVGILALVSGSAFTSMALVAASVLLPGMARDFQATPHVALLVQLVGATTPAALALGAPVAGRLVDRFGYRPVYLAGLVGFAAMGVLPAVLHDLYLILLARIGLGLSTAGIMIGLLAGIGTLAEARRAKLLGIQAFMGGVAAMLLYPLLALVAHHGWRPGFFVHASSLLLIPLVLSLPRGIRAAAHEKTAGAGGRVVAPTLIGVGVVTGMIMFISGVFAPLYLPSLGVTQPALWALPPTIGAGAGLALSASYGWIHARLSINALFALALGVIGAGLAVSGAANELVLFTVGVAMTGGGLALFAPTLSSAAIRHAGPHMAGRAVGLANGAFFGSQVFFPFISTPLEQMTGLRGVYLVFAGAALVMAAGYVWALTRGPASMAGPDLDAGPGRAPLSPHG